jgi:hypothetical protein
MFAHTLIALSTPITSMPCRGLCIWNFSVCGVGALYWSFPEAVIRFFLTALNVLMATMLLITLSPAIIFGLIGLLFPE